MTSMRDLVDEWLRLDPNAATRDEIATLWKDNDVEELEKRMRNRIEFGTAGLRGKMEAGWSRMNDLIIIQASQGLCKYVIENVSGAHYRGIIIGHDHRYNSERWAQLTAAVFIANDVKVYLHRGLVHTPLVPFSVKYLNAACGVMVTASHNPKQDNGYKVYWENAVQIIAPHDQGIADSIKNNLEPKTWSTVNVHALSLDVTEEMKNAYFASLSTLNTSKELNGKISFKFMNTSMHGVSDPFIVRAFGLFGFQSTSLLRVEEQKEPDPDFPTVSFPNPEEKGALNLAIKSANDNGAVYVLAQDPDSDRFSAAEKTRSGWNNFTGDQLGALFASRVLEQYKKSGRPLSKLAMVASTVSSKMVEKMAEVEGFRFVECLTGFKYIGNTARSFVDEGYIVPFGYEEAIGYMFGSDIRDKDGISATMMFAETVVELQESGESVQGYLESLYSLYGYFKTNNGYFICSDPVKIDSIFSRLRNFETPSGISYPEEIAGFKIISIIDLTAGYDSTNPPSYKPSLPLSSGHMIQFRGERDGLKIVLTTRTSGTEPKIKYYLEGSGRMEEREAVDAILPKVVKELGKIWFEADKYNLGHS